jgi:DNA polymerase-3 subunit gamma/tau
MAVLYRKYRPQTFAEVLSQKAIIQTLKNQVKDGSIAHAYLFTGSRGVGKTSVARILAKAVNCQNPQEGDACGKCSVCTQVEQGNFIDLIEIDAASNTGVENIRDLIDHVKFAPSQGRFKVFIIDEVHMLSKNAFNALLKTLEEPPKHAIFILATTEVNKVPATVISRTQRFEFKAYSVADLHEHLKKISNLEKLEFSEEVLQIVAQNAEGSARDALSLLGKVSTLGSSATVEEVEQLLGITDIAVCENLLQLIGQGKIAEIPDFYEKLFQSGVDHTIFNRDILEYLRKVLIYKISEGKISFSFSKEHLSQLQNFVELFSVPNLVFIIRLFLKSYKDLSGAPQPQIPLLIASVEAAIKKTVVQEVPATAEKKSPISSPVLETKHIAQQSIAETFISNEVQAISLEEALDLWPKIIAKVKVLNGPLASLLRGCQLHDVTANKIIVAVKFQFDKQNIESAKNSIVISDSIEALCGKKIAVVAQVQKTPIIDTASASEVISDVLKVFGGELVE